MDKRSCPLQQSATTIPLPSLGARFPSRRPLAAPAATNPIATIATRSRPRQKASARSDRTGQDRTGQDRITQERRGNRLEEGEEQTSRRDNNHRNNGNNTASPRRARFSKKGIGENKTKDKKKSPRPAASPSASRPQPPTMSILGKLLYSTLPHHPVRLRRLSCAILCYTPYMLIHAAPAVPPVTVLLLNAICIPSEDRFLARGMSACPYSLSLSLSLSPCLSSSLLGGARPSPSSLLPPPPFPSRPRPESLTFCLSLSFARAHHTVGLTPATYQRAFGQDVDSGVKYKVIQLIASVRTVMRGELPPLLPPPPPCHHHLVSLFLFLAVRHDIKRRELTSCLLAVPLIIINTLIIVYELVLG